MYFIDCFGEIYTEKDIRIKKIVF